MKEMKVIGSRIKVIYREFKGNMKGNDMIQKIL